MPSGKKHIIINRRERAISPDTNRLQSFAEADDAAAAQWLYNALWAQELNSGAPAPGPSTVLNPLFGTVLGGLMAQPSNGTVNMFVTPGVAWVVNPEAADTADDATLKFVNDPGVQTNGILTLTANGGGGIRIDVLECQPVETVLETDNRDIFDPGTGLFSPATVNKAAAYRMTYRIRVGTPGAGFPGTALGWLPLAVLSVPVAAGTWDAVTMWDVRPLASERAMPPFGKAIENPEMSLQFIDSFRDIGTGHLRVQGNVQAVAGFYKLGGLLQNGVPGAVTQYIDVNDAANQQPGFGFPNPGLWYIYLAALSPLPRWAVYSPASGGLRAPTFAGIPVVSAIAPTNAEGLTSVVMPASTGLGGGAAVGYAVVAGTSAGAGVVNGVLAEGSGQNMISPTTAGYTLLTLAPNGALTRTSCAFNLVDGASHPPHAKAVHVLLEVGLTSNGTPSFSKVEGGITVDSFVGGGGTIYAYDAGSIEWFHSAAGQGFSRNITVRIPLQPQVPNNFGIQTRKLTWTMNIGGTFTFVSASAQVVGWDF